MHTVARSTNSVITHSSTRASLRFIENVGQFDGRARFIARWGNTTVFVVGAALWLTIMAPMSKKNLQRRIRKVNKSPFLQLRNPRRSGVHLRISFIGANPEPTIEPISQLPFTLSYFRGRDAAQWHRSVPVWSGLRFKELFPGTDLEMSGANGRLEFRLTLADQSVFSAVRLRVEGAGSAALVRARATKDRKDINISHRSLRLSTPAGDVLFPLIAVDGSAQYKPRVRQIKEGVLEILNPFTVPLAGDESHLIGDDVRDLNYSTFLGGATGSGDEQANAVAVDSIGNTYVTGVARFFSFPTRPTRPGRLSSLRGLDDAFVAKFNPNAFGDASLKYAAILGGSGRDVRLPPWRPPAILPAPDEGGYGIAVDGDFNAYVTGQTVSHNDFPITVRAPQRNLRGFIDAFITKLNRDGTDLVYSTYLGGNGFDRGHDVAVDSAGNAYVVGITSSEEGFPVTPGAFQRRYGGGAFDGFVAKLNGTGNRLLYCSYLGGSLKDVAHGVAVDSEGQAHVTGDSASADFPTTPDAYSPARRGIENAFVTKIDRSGRRLLYSTYLGGSALDSALGIALDSVGKVYVVGHTNSRDFPTTPNAYQRVFAGGEGLGWGDCFITKLDTFGGGLAYSTLLGGDNDDFGGGTGFGHGIAVIGNGIVYVTGATRSPNFPTTEGAFRRSCGADGSCNFDGLEYHEDVFVARLYTTRSGRESLQYSTFLGGRGDNNGADIAVDNEARAHVVGHTDSPDFPVTRSAFQNSLGGGEDAFVVVLTLD